MPAGNPGNINSVLPARLAASFSVSKNDMKSFIRDFHSEMARGLAGRSSSLKMIPTYVDRPTGKEKGTFLALDLGGTNFRILMLKLDGRGGAKVIKAEKFVLDKKVITGPGKAFFDFIASCIGSFLGSNTGGHLDMGFTFSFAVEQTGVASGTLSHWTKGFSAAGVLGKDVVMLLYEAMLRKGIRNVSIKALANDTVGTLVSRAYADPACDMGVILGTGTNACYSEYLSNVPKWRGTDTPGGRMIINTEWGNFNKVKRTYYDKAVDRISDNRGQQIMEKMVSGMYLGEIVRLVCGALISDNRLFGGRRTPVFFEAQGFRSEYVSRIERDRTRDLSDVGSMLKELGVTGSTVPDRILVLEVCRLVSLRASRISAAAIAAVITRMDGALSRRHTVAMDGSVYEKHPNFAGHIRTALNELFGIKARRIKISLTKDGSGKGAAIIASVAASSNI